MAPNKTNSDVRSENYPGSKFGSGVSQQIISTFPKHSCYIESFYGSGAIMKIKDASAVNIGIDIDPRVSEYFKFSPGSFFINSDSIKLLALLTPIINFIHSVLHFPILIYSDPPYPKNTRRSGNDCYKFELSTNDHIELLNVMRSLKCYCVISTYDNKFYSDTLQGWNKKSFNSRSRLHNTIETIYYNFPASLPLHQYNFIGSNFRDRAAIKGRVQRTVTKFLKMPPAELSLFLNTLSNSLNISDFFTNNKK